MAFRSGENMLAPEKTASEYSAARRGTEVSQMRFLGRPSVAAPSLGPDAIAMDRSNRDGAETSNGDDMDFEQSSALQVNQLQKDFQAFMERRNTMLSKRSGAPHTQVSAEPLETSQVDQKVDHDFNFKLLNTSERASVNRTPGRLQGKLSSIFLKIILFYDICRAENIY